MGDGTVARTCVRSLLVAWLAVAPVAHAKDGPPLFESETPLAVTLQADWPAVLKPGAAATPRPAAIVYTGANGEAQRLAATVETRGLTRRRLCKFPPLRLRFAKDATAGTEFARQESLKLVTHCDTAAAYREYYVQEWLAYRVYNLVTPASFRARALDATYADAGGGRGNGPHFAFLIEGAGDMARRNGLKRDARARFRPGDFDSLALSRFMLFQYLLGNTDWDVLVGPERDACCHNVRVVGGDGTAKRIPVPYDFDSSGLVNAKYAAPHEALPIRNVRQRLYRGICTHNDTLDQARRQYQDLRPRIVALFANEPRLGASRRKAALAYIDDFYAVLDDDARFAQEITAKCRK